MATRSQVREVVVQLLYAYDSGNEGISKFVEEILEEHKIKNAQKNFAQELFSGVIANLESLDLRITHQLKDWDFERIGNIERAILRLGAYEIVFSKVDKAVVINEALEIAKNFSYELSVKFINGVLDGIAKNYKLSLKEIQVILEQQKISKEEEKARQKANETSKESLQKTIQKPRKVFGTPKVNTLKNTKSSRATKAKSKKSHHFKDKKSESRDSKSSKTKDLAAAQTKRGGKSGEKIQKNFKNLTPKDK